MVYHGLFGMAFEADGVRFAPVVPERFQELTLSNVKYRDAQLHIAVKGAGTRVHQFKFDGKTQRKPFFPASNKGPHEIEILLR
jgi:cellobiose phosphorylase